MENGMADIPENPTNPSTAGTDSQSYGYGNSERLDPRSGMVSPAAWRTTTNESNVHPGPAPPQVGGSGSGALNEARNFDLAPQGHRHLGAGRSQTEDFEMTRMRQ